MRWGILCCIFWSMPVFAGGQDKVVYGEDNRADRYAVSQAYKQAADSTVALIKSNQLTQRNGRYYLASSPTGKDRGWCQHERFSEQPVQAFCSGFMVGKDLIATAGHCVKGNTGDRCKDIKFVFGFAMTNQQTAKLSFAAKDVYQCQSIVAGALSSDKTDWRVVRVDRPIKGHKPLRIRREGKVSSQTGLTVIGHPSGLPVKITTAGNIQNNDHAIYFSTNLDTYGGNSGSAVLSSQSIIDGKPLVEGILVRGATDYVVGKRSWDKGKRCYVSNRCTQVGVGVGCQGEEVTRIQLLSQYVPKLESEAVSPPSSSWDNAPVFVEPDQGQSAQDQGQFPQDNGQSPQDNGQFPQGNGQSPQEMTKDDQDLQRIFFE